jgi:hypothetical protein
MPPAGVEMTNGLAQLYLVVVWITGYLVYILYAT